MPPRNGPLNLAAIEAVDALPLIEILPVADLSVWARSPAVPTAFLLAGFVPMRELTLATGVGGANKSTFGQQLATCCAAGIPMLGIDVQQAVSLYVTAEDDENRLHWMQEHICKAVGVSLSDLAGRLHIASLRGRLGNEFASFDAEGKLRPTKTFQMLRDTIARIGAKLVVLDNSAHFFAGNENDRQQVTAFVNLLYSLSLDLGATIILVAHTNKAGDSYSGSTAWLNAVRSQIVLSKPDDAVDPDERLLALGKANYARQGAELRFRWHNFALITDDDLPVGTAESLAATAAAAGDNAIFLACLDARTRDGLIVSPNRSPNYAPTQFEAMPAAKGIGKERLCRAMERLLALGEIEVYDHENRDKKRSVKALRRGSRTSPNGSPDASRTVSRTLPGLTPNTSRTPPHKHPPPTGEAGVAHGAAAPALGTPQTHPPHDGPQHERNTHP